MEKKSDGNPCRRPHHKLLHLGQPSNLGAQVAFVQDQQQALLPILTGLVKGPNSEAAAANIFYENGAQVSMVRSSFAKSLFLEGKPIRILVTKVGCTEEELVTKLY